MNSENIELLKRGAASFGITLIEEHVEQFIRYYKKLIDWNEKINLTAITEEREVVIKHFIDSFSVAPYISPGSKKLIDVGTGAGFPGIPLKMVNKDLTVTLLDSLDKRIRFLNEVINDTGLAGIQAIHGRAEELARDKGHRELYDVGVARAVASLPVLCEYVLPFIKIGGSFIAMKGSNVNDEVQLSKKAVSMLGGEIKTVDRFLLPFEEMERHIISIVKIRQTPTQFPRKSGKPTKSPIV